MQKRSFIFTVLLIVLAGLPLPLSANDLDKLPAEVTFMISGGSWEDPGAPDANGIVKNPKMSSNTTRPEKETRHGYYRLISVMQPDRTGKVFLQQMQVTDTGNHPIDTVELQEISDLHAYITDIRTDDTSGINSTLGFLASVYLKTNPKAADPESWNVIIDEFGEIQVARESH